MIYYTSTEFQKDLDSFSFSYISHYASHYASIYGIPRGGVPLAVALSLQFGIPIVEKPEDGTIIVDDIIDSGKTRNKYPNHDFICLHMKADADISACSGRTYAVHKDVNDWIVYFWEKDTKGSIEDTIIRQIQCIGDNPNREGLLETPKRIINAWVELYAGYKQDPAKLFKTFAADGYDQMVLLKDIEVFSTCEHHMLPFFGKAHVAYIPDKKVIGISKLARLVDIFARRLQIQERLGEQITTTLMQYLKPQGTACIIEATHLCMRMRGCSKQHSIMTTSSLKGVFLDNAAARSELMGLIK